MVAPAADIATATPHLPVAASAADRSTDSARRTHKQEQPLETLDNKRARLRHELRQAHGAWLRESEPAAHAIYLAAKQRLTAAYAETAPAT